ncbi:hypothetical protein DM2_2578 [Halorubrum sp. DM2]|uniref:hypothetical protein n=1 Tax=Halorubrum sp. DM2 TaxID=2527867 RepID=UPI0024B6FEBD|nr:hypothetical protein [Halorubrum sp. DM2]VTT86540.1 hypothetical protein DM2_2578 [Halorubrum sp. DM2]
MSDSPRRARANGWAWACLVLFGADAESGDSRDDGPTGDGPTDKEPSEGGSTASE